MEQAGFISHREKIARLGLDFQPSKLTQAPILDACPVVLDCQVDRIIEEDGICHIFAKIVDRLANPGLLDDKGHFKNDRFAPTYFMGDGHKRVYRYLDDRVDPMGSFIKKARKKDDKSWIARTNRNGASSFTSPNSGEDDVLEIGYTLHPDYWGRGYVPEVARALIDLAFKDLSLHKIELTCFGYNVQSQRVAEKLGFTLEARIRDRKDAQGKRCDSLIYGLLKSEWEA